MIAYLLNFAWTRSFSSWSLGPPASVVSNYRPFPVNRVRGLASRLAGEIVDLIVRQTVVFPRGLLRAPQVSDHSSSIELRHALSGGVIAEDVKVPSIGSKGQELGLQVFPERLAFHRSLGDARSASAGGCAGLQVSVRLMTPGLGSLASVTKVHQFARHQIGDDLSLVERLQ